MKSAPVVPRIWIFALALIAAPLLQAVWIEDEIPANVIKVIASSEYSPQQAALRLVDGSGIQNGLHDNSGSAETMWHTTERPALTKAADGLPPAPAWVRFDFARPQKFDSIHVWNHNQANLTNRGFRKTRIFGSANGVSWIALTSPDVIELPQAGGSPGLEAFIISNVAKSVALQAVVIAAEPNDGNYGSDYYGLSAVRFVEGAHIGFGFNVPSPSVRIDIPWAVIQPEQDQLAGACKNWFSVERWVDLSNDKLGVTWSTVEAPLVEMGGLTANLPRSQPDPKAYLAHIKPSSAIYSWIMNNHWHTNYRADQQGETVFHYAIRLHAAYDQTAAAHFGVETTEPLLVAPALGVPPRPSLVEIGTGPVMITSLSPSKDGKALILRLYNTGPTPATAVLKWNEVSPREISISDLSGRPGQPVAEPLEMAPYELRTLRAELN